MTPTRHGAWLLALLLAGCEPVSLTPDTAGPDAGSDAPADGGVDARMRDVGLQREAGPLPDARIPSADDDGNTRFSEAAPLPFGGVEVAGEISSDDDHDYLRFEATPGQYIAVMMRRPDDGSFGFEPEVVLVGPDMRAIVRPSDENGCSGALLEGESEMVTRIAQGGTHYVELSHGYLSVDDYGAMPWIVRLVDLATAPETLILADGERGPITEAHRCVFGAFETEGDEDLVEVALDPYRLISIYDPGRHGSTGGASLIELTRGGSLRARGTAAVAMDGPGMFEARIVGRARLGAFDHYLIRPLPLGYYGPGVGHVEAEDATNDEVATPELITLGPSDEGGYRPQLALTLPAGDVDHFAVDLMGSGYLSVDCTARGTGGAVRGLEVTLLDLAGEVLAVGREGTMFGATFERSDLPDGVYTFRVSAGAPDPTIEGHLVSCAVSDGS